MIDFTQFKSLVALTNYFTDDEICKQTILDSRFESHFYVCPKCGSVHCVIRGNGRLRCNSCHHNFSCLVGTIFENTKVSLRKWFIAMYLVSSHKKGVSSCQLARDIEVTQTTAWYMLQKIRTLFAQDDSEALSGIVECDEVYVGGKEKWKHANLRTPHTQGRSTATKTPVFGMMERTSFVNSKGMTETMSIVRAMVVEKTDKATLVPIIKQFVAEGSVVMTDELSAYGKLGEEGYIHRVVNHGASEFVCGNVFTNDIEGFWGHFRRMILGCYHDCSDKHLQKYVDESAYRWNTRKWSENERFVDMFKKSIGCVLTWKQVREYGMCA